MPPRLVEIRAVAPSLEGRQRSWTEWGCRVSGVSAENRFERARDTRGMLSQWLGFRAEPDCSLVGIPHSRMRLY